MRSSAFFLSLALILSIQLTFALDDEVGIWTNFEATSSGNPYCCIPSSLTFYNTSVPKVLIASFKFDGASSGRKAQCLKLFPDAKDTLQGNLTLTKDTGIYSTFIEDGSGKYFALQFQAFAGHLTVYTPAQLIENRCEYSMLNKEDLPTPTPVPVPVPDTPMFPAFLVPLLLVVVVALIGAIGFLIYRQKQEKNIAQQQNASFASNNAYGGYNAPGAYNPNQQYA